MMQPQYLDNALMLMRATHNEGAKALSDQISKLVSEGNDPELLIAAMAIQGVNLATMLSVVRESTVDESFEALNRWVIRNERGNE